MRSECGNKAGPQLLRWTANSPSACDNGRLIANTLKMFYLSPADFYLKLPLYPAGEIVGVFLFFFPPLSPHFHGRPFFSRATEFSGQTKRSSHGNQLGVMTKKRCNKGPLCNLMCSETEPTAHFNEPRYPFTNHIGGGNGTLAHLRGRTQNTLRMCDDFLLTLGKRPTESSPCRGLSKQGDILWPVLFIICWGNVR